MGKLLNIIGLTEKDYFLILNLLYSKRSELQKNSTELLNIESIEQINNILSLLDSAYFN